MLGLRCFVSLSLECNAKLEHVHEDERWKTKAGRHEYCWYGRLWEMMNKKQPGLEFSTAGGGFEDGK